MTADTSLPLAPDKAKARAEAKTEVAAIEAAIDEVAGWAQALIDDDFDDPAVDRVAVVFLGHAAIDHKRLAAHAACSDLGKRACDVRNQLLDVYGVTP